MNNCNLVPAEFGEKPEKRTKRQSDDISVTERARNKRQTPFERGEKVIHIFCSSLARRTLGFRDIWPQSYQSRQARPKTGETLTLKPLEKCENNNLKFWNSFELVGNLVMITMSGRWTYLGKNWRLQISFSGPMSKNGLQPLDVHYVELCMWRQRVDMKCGNRHFPHSRCATIVQRCCRGCRTSCWPPYSRIHPQAAASTPLK